MYRITRFVIASVSLLAILLAACAPTAAPTVAAPTVAVPTVASKPTSAPTQAAPIRTAAPTNTAAPTAPAATPTASLTVTTAAQIAVQLPDDSVLLIDGAGKKTPLAKLDGNVDPLAVLLAQDSTGGTLYLPLSAPAGGVVQVDANRTRKLDWIKGTVTGVAVSVNRIAWGTSDLSASPASSQLVISGLDGSEAKTIVKESYTGIPQVMHPFRWSQDRQRLYFSKEPTGLGGYILFGGITNVWSYDLRDGKTTEIVHQPAQNAMICIDDVAPNEQIIVDHCGVNKIQLTSLADKKTTVYNPPANVGPVGVVGSARFSPDGSVVAYGLARRNPDDEQGWVAITGSGSDSKLIATSPAKDYFSVAGWLDNETIVLQSSLQGPGVWVVRSDGSGLKRLTDGTFLGIVGGLTGSLTPLAPGTTPASETAGLPASCQPKSAQTKSYVNRQGGYCFVYPARFQPGDLNNGQPNIVGPALDNSPDPLRATLTVEVKTAPAGSDLAKLVNAFIAEQPQVTPGITHQPSNLGLGGQRAEVLENVPGRLSSRNVIVLTNGKLYNLWFQPTGVAKAAPDLEELFQTVTGSFAFLP